MSDYRRGESPQSMRACARHIRDVFTAVEKTGGEMNYRTAYQVLDAVIQQCDDVLAKWGKAGQR